MKDYIKKYRNDELSHSELLQLRQRLEGMTDEELSECLGNDWEASAVDVSLPDNGKTEQIRATINTELSSSQGKRGVVRRLFNYAAILLIVVLSVATIYFFNESRSQLNSDMTVTTGKGESACVSLPDGSKVTLFYESLLSYGNQSFTNDKREVRFEGDGFFEIHGDKECPFVVESKGLSVTVLGTTFSLSARQTDDTAELYLEKGSVSLRSSLTDEQVMIKPNECACVNYKTGRITVERMAANPHTLHKGFLSFNSVPLSKVINTLQSNFACEIVVDNKPLLQKTFSGTLPSRNIDAALEVLRLSFNTNVSRDGNIYTIR